MKKNYLLFLTLTLFANETQIVGNTTTALDDEWFTFVSLTPTSVVLKTTSRGRHVVYTIPNIEGSKRGYNYQLKLESLDLLRLVENEDFAIPLDKEVTFSDGRHHKNIYTPILLENQQSGFRFTYLTYNLRGGFESTISYIALNDSPEQVDESEVVMILENGEWVKFEDSENLEIIKLRWKGALLINDPTLFWPETIAKISDGSYYSGPLLAELFENGLFTPTEEMLAALKSGGYLPSDEEPDVNTPLIPLIAPEEPSAQTNEIILPPSSHPIHRVWFWWLALPVVVGVWFVFYLKRRRH